MFGNEGIAGEKKARLTVILESGKRDLELTAHSEENEEWEIAPSTKERDGLELPPSGQR